MRYIRYCSTTLEKLPHLKNIKKCWQTDDGVYDILYEDVKADNGIIYAHLLIQRIDGKPIRSYMDLQEIKNDLFGEDIPAVEIFPKKDDLCNGSNTSHLWAWKDIEIPNLVNITGYSKSIVKT
jgi:hypothetical protein